MSSPHYYSEVWTLIASKLTTMDLLSLLRTCKSIRECCLVQLLSCPVFFTSKEFITFLHCITVNCVEDSEWTFSKLFIKSISLNTLELGLYDELPDSWLSQLLLNAPNMQALNCSDVAFINDKTIQLIKSQTDLRHLNLSHTRNLSAAGACKLIQYSPYLETVIADDTGYMVNDKFLSTCIETLKNLVHLSLCMSNISNSGLYHAFSGKSKLKLKMLILDECHNIDDEYLYALPMLTHLSLSKCRKITCNGIESFARSKPPLIHLDLSFMPNLKLDFTKWTFIAYSVGETLESLRIPFIGFDLKNDEKSNLRTWFGHLKVLKTLTFTDINRKSPRKMFWDLGITMEGLKDMILIREYYERDDMLGGYARIEEGECMVDEEFVKRFNASQGKCRMQLLT